MKTLTIAGLKTRYRKTFAGFLWVILNPLITFGVQALVFGMFLKINVEHYLLFLVSGLVPWIFIAQTLDMTTSVFVNSSQLMKSFSASPLVYLSAQVLDNLINFIVGFAVALLPIWICDSGISPHLLLLPLPIISLAVAVFALSWLLAIAHVFFRDTRFLITFGLQIAFFLTPIFYPPSYVPAAFRWLIFLNPLYFLIEPFHVLIHGFEPIHFVVAMAAATVTAGALWVAAFSLWQSRRNLVYFHV